MQCWEWERGRSQGYGYVWLDNKMQRVHRIAYEAIIGPIPANLELDHLCRNRACYNPEHLEPVTRKENTRRGKSGHMVTSCPKGHSYSGDNLYTELSTGHRKCKTCKHTRDKAYYEKRKQNEA